MNRALLWAAFAHALLGACATASKNVQPTNPVRVTKAPSETADGGFVLEVTKILGDKKSAALVVRYMWRGQPEREAWVSDAGESWRIQFQDKPEPSEITTLKLIYSLPVGADEQRGIQSHFDAIATAFVDAAIEALGALQSETADRDAAFRDALNWKLQAIEAALHELDKYTTKDRKSGSELALTALGLVRVAGKLEVTSAAYRKLATFAERNQDLTQWARKESEYAPTKRSVAKCADGVIDPQATDTNVLLTFARNCRSDLVTWLRSAAKSYESRADGKKAIAGAAFNANWTAFVRSIDILDRASIDDATLRDARSPGDMSLFKALAEVDNTYRNLNQPLPAGANGASLKALQMPESFGTAQWAVARLRGIQLKNAASSAFAQKLVVETKALSQEQVGSLLLERALERRYWDFATGAVYVTHLDDTVVPILLAFCPGTCLRRGENAFGDGIARSISFDIGTRIGVVDSSTDPRHLDRPGLLVGVSLNPFYFVRASVGFYSFDNAQTHRWNSAVYFGVTVNMIHAAELLGPLGVGPGRIETKDAPKERQSP